jgi:hypothetical protein
MRWMIWVGGGTILATVGYVLIGLTVYDFDRPIYESEGSDRIIDELEFEGARYWTRVGTWRFTGYQPGSITTCLAGSEDLYRIYFRIEPAFRPLASIVRQAQGYSYRGEWHEDESSDPDWRGCSRSTRWMALEP